MKCALDECIAADIRKVTLKSKSSSQQLHLVSKLRWFPLLSQSAKFTTLIVRERFSYKTKTICSAPKSPRSNQYWFPSPSSPMGMMTMKMTSDIVVSIGHASIAAAAEFPSLGTSIKLERIQIQMSLGRTWRQRARHKGEAIEIQRILQSTKRDSEMKEKPDRTREEGRKRAEERRSKESKLREAKPQRSARGEKKKSTCIAHVGKRGRRISGTEKMDRKNGRRRKRVSASDHARTSLYAHVYASPPRRRYIGNIRRGHHRLCMFYAAARIFSRLRMIYDAPCARGYRLLYAIGSEACHRVHVSWDFPVLLRRTEMPGYTWEILHDATYRCSIDRNDTRRINFPLSRSRRRAAIEGRTPGKTRDWPLKWIRLWKQMIFFKWLFFKRSRRLRFFLAYYLSFQRSIRESDIFHRVAPRFSHKSTFRIRLTGKLWVSTVDL